MTNAAALFGMNKLLLMVLRGVGRPHDVQVVGCRRGVCCRRCRGPGLLLWLGSLCQRAPRFVGEYNLSLLEEDDLTVPVAG